MRFFTNQKFAVSSYKCLRETVRALFLNELAIRASNSPYTANVESRLNLPTPYE